MDEALQLEEKYTYGDYLKMGDEVRCEIIGGVIYNMSPAPGRKHQGVSMNLATAIGVYLVGKTCRVFCAPFDVRLPEKGEKSKDTTNVVQPDISVICDTKKLDSRGCKGAPDWIIEIISPTSGRRDRRDKFMLYENAGVKEYWIVNPKTHLISVFVLEKDGMFGSEKVYEEGQTVSPSTFPELVIDLEQIFRD